MAKKRNDDFNAGYEAAKEAIRDILNQNGGQGGQGSGGGSGDISDLPMPNIPQGGQGSGSGSGNDQGSNGNSKQAGPSAKVEDGDSVYEVQQSDCEGPAGLDNVPGTPGSMIAREDGKKIAKSEGHDDGGMSSEQASKSWAEIAKKAAKQIGNSAGGIKEKLEGLYKTNHDWKTALKRVVGRAISPDEKRQAYANKNVLVGQDRISRTDKDKYDNLSYITAFIDSSGSMDNNQLKMCLSCVLEVALAKKPIKIYVIQCDTRIQDIQEYRSVKELEKSLKTATVKGRGGTDLKPCWDLLSDKKDKRFAGKQAELVMCFTDGYLTQYKRNPKTMRNLCWVIIDNPSFEVEHKDVNTKLIHISSSDVK